MDTLKDRLSLLARVALRACVSSLRGGRKDQDWVARLLEDLPEDRETRAIVVEWLSAPPAPLQRLAELSARFKLDALEVEIFLLTAAPAVDPQVGALYAHFMAVKRTSPRIGFLAELIAQGDSARFEAVVAKLEISSPLRRHRLLLLEPYVHRGRTRPRIERRLHVSDRALSFLREDPETKTRDVDEVLSSFCTRQVELTPIEALRLPREGASGLVQLVRGRRLPAILEGPEGAAKQSAAEATASLMNRGLLRADLNTLLSLPEEALQDLLADLLREARLGHDLIYLQAASLPDQVSARAQHMIKEALAGEQILIGVDTMPLWLIELTVGWPLIHVPLPDFDHRLELWQLAFASARRRPKPKAIEAIARRYEMSSVQIRHAANEATRLASLSRGRHIPLTDLDRACRTYFAHRLADLAELVPPGTLTPEQLILPEGEKEKFEEVLLYAKEYDTIYRDWGFDAKFPYGRGLSVLFFGPPGTGKTMATSIISSVLGLDLFRVDLSRIISRYVGETEKNLARVFEEAKRGKVMLLFDEADALFTKRTMVSSSFDRYANLEVAYLLQLMEDFEGISILTTNVETQLDEALKRRLRYRIYFPMPDAEARARLWSSMLPSEAPVKEDIPFDLLGERFELSGGHIKKAVLKAAFFARRRNTSIGLETLLEAGDAECRELGMLLNDKLPKPLRRALALERGEPEPKDEEEEEMPWYPTRPPGV